MSGKWVRNPNTVYLYTQKKFIIKQFDVVFSDKSYIGNIAETKSVNWENMENIFIITKF